MSAVSSPAVSPSPPSPSARTKRPEASFFSNPLSPQDPIGPYLRYDPIYDDIRLWRQEDDPQLSMGIWKTDLKYADWGKVEQICIETLSTRSKDLQIAAWLAEAWTSLDGIEGYTRGIQLIENLCQNFWPILHPQPQNEGDMENRDLLWEWMNETLSTRLLFIPLTQSKLDETSFGLGFLKSAQHADAAQKRMDNTGKSAPKNDTARTPKALDEFQKSLDQTSEAFLSTHQQNLTQAIQATQTLKDTLVSLRGPAAPSFSLLLGTLKEMDRVLTSTLQTRQPSPLEPEPDMTQPPHTSETPVPNITPNHSSSYNLDIKTRQEAYRHLTLIADFLETNDPHSPAHQLIRQLIQWENKNILDIFGEIAQSPQELGILMKLLGSGPKK